MPPIMTCSCRQLAANRKPAEFAAENEAVYAAWKDAFIAHGVSLIDTPADPAAAPEVRPFMHSLDSVDFFILIIYFFVRVSWFLVHWRQYRGELAVRSACRKFVRDPNFLAFQN